jgi:hypothetical protein
MNVPSSDSLSRSSSDRPASIPSASSEENAGGGTRAITARAKLTSAAYPSSSSSVG